MKRLEDEVDGFDADERDDDTAEAVDEHVFAAARRLRRAGRYETPRKASGISAMMMSALKITAERIALCGVARCMMFNAFISGYVTTNIAGRIAKYLATSFAIRETS